MDVGYQGMLNRQLTGNYAQFLDVDQGLVLAVLGVEVGWEMISRIHSNNDAVKPANLGHDLAHA